MLVPYDVHIRSHPLNEQHEQITLLEGKKSLILRFKETGFEPIVLLEL